MPKIVCTVGSVLRKNDGILFVRQTYGRLTNKWTLTWGVVEGRRLDAAGIDTPDEAAPRETIEEGGVARR